MAKSIRDMTTEERAGEYLRAWPRMSHAERHRLLVLYLQYAFQEGRESGGKEIMAIIDRHAPLREAPAP